MSTITQSEKIGATIGIVVVIGFIVIFANPFGGGEDGAAGIAFEDLTVNNEEDSMDDNEGRLEVTVLTEGSGDSAEVGQLVTVNYTGTFEDGTVFDSSLGEGREPFSFIIGAGQVIPGWDQGVQGMLVGEKRQLVIPPSLGYGANDYGPIPGGSTLIFEVELLGVSDIGE